MRALLVTMVLVLVLPAAAAPDGEGEPPTVEIEQPLGGWSTSRVITVSGTVSDESISLGQLVVNGYARTLSISGGRFQASLVLSRGANSIEVVASNRYGEGRDRVSFFSDVPPVDMQVVLSWDTDGTDVDLHVVDPTGEECYYGHRQTRLGGTLDVDDTDGFGPEVFTLAHAASGSYRVRVKYYSSHGHPQTAARVQVVMFEGTAREQRLEFLKLLTKTGDKVDVGTWRVEGDQADIATTKKGG